MDGRRWVATLLLALLVLPAVAATGRITDAKTGKPISGATVFAVWYYHVSPLPIPFLAHGPSMGGDACGDAAIVKTDANGEYDLGFWMNLQIRFRKSALWTFAPGYFDINQTNPWSRYGDKDGLLVGTADPDRQPSAWTRTLVPVSNESTTVKLIAMSRSGSAETCMRGRLWIAPYSHESKYNAIIQESLNQALCDASVQKDPPRTDVFKALFDPFQGMPKGWRQYVLPYLPEDEKEPVPNDVLWSACDLLFPVDDESRRTARRANLRGHRQIRVIDVESGNPLARLPIRILWGRGWAHHERDGGNETSMYPLRSIVAMTNDFGQYDLEITPTLVAEQQLESYEGWAGMAYSVAPYSNDVVAFIPDSQRNDESCAALLDTTIPGQLGRTFGRHLDDRICTSRIGKNPGVDSLAMPATAQPEQQDNANTSDSGIFDKLTQFAAAEYEVRVSSNEFRRNSVNPARIRAYRWKWPADALVARADGLLDAIVPIETSEESLLTLQRNQVSAAFSKMCEEASDAPVADAFVVSRLLWWVETQTRGIDKADEHAQSRSDLYENGKRCYSRNGHQPQGKPGRIPLTKVKTCEIWKAIGSLDSPPYGPEASFASLKYDVQCQRYE